jgi:hypothetical protein
MRKVEIGSKLMDNREKAKTAKEMGCLVLYMCGEE